MPTQSAPTWADILTPSICPCCDQMVMPSAQDVFGAFSNSVTEGLRQMSTAAGSTAASSSTTTTQRHSHQHSGSHGSHDKSSHQSGHGHSHSHSKHGGHQHSDCGCDSCNDCGCHDDCHCQCCIGSDIDLVVYSRLGERRLVPLTLVNERRREREIVLELSGFTTKGGSAVPVTGTILGASSFTLAPCQKQAVTLVIESGANQGTTYNTTGTAQAETSTTADTADTANNADTATNADTSDTGLAATNVTPTRFITPDVDDCVVAVADLSVKGCEIKCPIRIGVVLLPLDCDAYDITCGCSCC
jgi:hypothetical protein